MLCRIASMRKLVLMAFLALATHTANAQWVNYKAPGTPRLAGRPAESGRARAARPDGKPDLSGVWHVQPTSREEMKKLFGNDVDTIEVPGMEIDTISKYAVNIFLDLKPADWPVKPAWPKSLPAAATASPRRCR